VAVIKNVPGIREDPAYFLPRAFAGVTRQPTHKLAGDNNWIAFRSNEWDEAAPPLNIIKKSGWGIGQVFTTKAQGQQAFFVQLVKRSE